MRPLRILLDSGLPVLGMGLIVGAILLLESIYSQLAIAIVGFVGIQVGMWQLAHRFLPSDRRFHALRRELDAFVEGARQLNQAALAIKINDSPEQRAVFDDLRRALHQSVEVIAAVAGHTQEELSCAPREEMTLGDSTDDCVARSGCEITASS